jgi:ribose transport system substrate-binding protein
VAVGVVVALLAAGCGGSDNDSGSTGSGGTATTTAGAAQKPFTVGMLVNSLDRQFFVDQVKQLTALVEQAGGKLVTGVYDNDPVKELHIAQDWIQSGQVDVITGGLLVQGFQPALDLAAEKKVPVVLIGAEPTKPLQAGQTSVVQNFKQWGEVVGEELARCVQDRLGGRGEVAILTGPDVPGPVVVDRIAGMKEKLASGAPGAKFVAEAPGNDTQLTSLQAIQTILQAHPDINVVGSVGDDGELGALKALENAGRDATKLCLVGPGMGDASLAALRAGRFYAVTDIGLDQIYRTVIDAVVALHQNINDPRFSKQVLTTQYTRPVYR